MSITAKELAEKLNLSQTAVSMALNNKPGVSTETRRMVIEKMCIRDSMGTLLRQLFSKRYISLCCIVDSIAKA